MMPLDRLSAFVLISQAKPDDLVRIVLPAPFQVIAEQGAFSGSADIDIAEIHGAFDGKLTVRQKLVIHSTGRVTGTVRYGRLVIEDGGQLAGDVALGGHTPMQATLLAA